MRRAFLLVVFLAVPAGAAPQLKDRKPAADPEAARIAALKARYAAVRASGQRAENQKLDLAHLKLQVHWLLLDDLARQQITPEARRQRECELEREIRADSMVQDLYDIAVYDRKKAAGKK